MQMRSIYYQAFTVVTLWLISQGALIAQGGPGNGQINTFTYHIPSTFNPEVKEGNKITDVPEIVDSAKKIPVSMPGIASKALPVQYELSPIVAAKMKNEPLAKLYNSLLKGGYGLYNTPYIEYFINSGRNRELSYGARLKHISSTTQLKGFGYGGFSENEVAVNGIKFFKKHTLTGSVDYARQVIHRYGYPDSLIAKDSAETASNATRQCYNLVGFKTDLVSHFPDSGALNHAVKLNFYNYGNRVGNFENNIFLDARLDTKVNGENLVILLDNDFYNWRSNYDTLNNNITKLGAYFKSSGKKWKADVGMQMAIDYFSNGDARFYFLPRLNVEYDVFNHIIIPYAGLNGGYTKNSYRGLTEQNPFLVNEPNFKNTYSPYLLHVGLRGALSSKTSYDVKCAYGEYRNMPLFMTYYDRFLNNSYQVVYDTVSLLQVTGQIKYDIGEKLSVFGKGNYYGYSTKNQLSAWFKPMFDVNAGLVYNIQSKIITKVDMFFIGSQVANRPVGDNMYPQQFKKEVLKGMADINVAFEYRYTSMLSFFLRLNNVGNFKYYRWDRYPTQGFNGMLGFTFVPF